MFRLTQIKLFIPLLIFIVLASMLYWGLGRDPNAMPSVLVDKPVPLFNLPSLDIPLESAVDEPEPLVNQSVFKGQVTLLNVWATWCPSCRIEHPFLLELAERGVPIIGLDYKDENAKARLWLEEYGNPYQLVIVDQQGKLGLDLGVFGAPETYLIDSEGLIRHKHVGVVDERVWQSDFLALYNSFGGATVSVKGGEVRP